MMSDNETIINLLRTANNQLAAQGNEHGGDARLTPALPSSAVEPLMKKGISGVGSVLGGIMNMPKEMLEASARDVSVLGDHNFEKESAGPAAEMAMNLVGGGMPMAEKGAAGIFGGRLAKTADLKALQEAERMRMNGLHPHDVWSDTGWFKSPTDQKWRFEIPDNQARLNHMPVGEGSSARASFATMLHHPELFKAYPDLQKYPTIVTKDSGIRSGQFDKDLISAVGPDAKDLISTLLHEGQHGVQWLEGFRPGANPAYYAEMIEKGLKAKPEKFAAYDFNAIKKEADSLYHKTAGEVEARNVQKRKDYYPIERNEVPPWVTQDVKFEDQLIFDPVANTLEALRRK